MAVKVNRTVHYVKPGIKEVLTVHRGVASGGTWKLTIDGFGVNLAFNASALVVENAVKALMTVNDATVTGTGTSGDPWIITIDDPITHLVSEGDGSLLQPSDLLVFVETTSGADVGHAKPAIVTALGAGDQVDVRIGHHGETYADADLMVNSDDVSVWYPGSRRQYPPS